MADSGVDRVLGSLGVSFDALVAREEEAAASDLAFSLLQDISLRDRLLRAGSLRLRLSDGRLLPVSEVGMDYVATEGEARVVMPLDTAVVVAAGHGPSPRATDETWLELARGCARRGRNVELSTYCGPVAGRIASACPDHLAVETSTGRMLVGLRAIRSMTLARGSSAGAF